MLSLPLTGAAGKPLRVLCLGAHSDDIEIGCGGTVLALIAQVPCVEVAWVVLSGTGPRAEEARRSAALFLHGALKANVAVRDFRDGFFPYEGGRLKEYFEELKGAPGPDVIFTHHRADRHQDHRLVSDLTWNTFRDHLILEYEIPKYDGDLGRPNCYVPLDDAHCRTKVRHLLDAFPSQRDRRWFTEETFRALLRLRGVECASPTGYAEAFHAHKWTLTPGTLGDGAGAA
jgi:LmbE family N-acetylglucosaminyl deacetylase